jgi:hypothetical protein
MRCPIYVGIDPGASGGICIAYSILGHDLHSIKGLTEPEICEVFAKVAEHSRIDERPIVVALEKVGGYIGGKDKSFQTSSSGFRFGESYGFLRGAVTMLAIASTRISIHEVTPQKWQAGLYGIAGKQGADRKRTLKQIAQQQFPQLQRQITLQTCDALLIADWARTNIKNK